MGTIPDNKTIFDSQIGDQVEDTTRISIERPVLITLDGHDVNKRHSIDKPELTLGRELLMNHIVLDDARASRRHARLVYKNFHMPAETPEIWAEDMNSTNGIFVNGMKVTKQLLHNRDKILVGSTLFGFFLRDEQEVLADERLYQLANHDALTGLNNRGVFNNEIHREFDRARRYRRALALVMFDIDHFKRFNDNHGHLMGDFVLQEIGRLAMANTRSNDMAARYGGEEFAFILPETNLEGAVVQAERMRQSVLEKRMQNNGTQVNVTISVGVSAIEDRMQSYEDMIRITDQALYHAKESGRNAVCWTQASQYKIGAYHSNA
jgi:two-component system, cell cycle response regulator